MGNKEFDVMICPNSRGSSLKELARYKDLIRLFVRRDFVTGYKQTVLGPVWAVLQPLLYTAIFAVIFGNVAGLSPEGVPVFLYYLAGQVVWIFFQGSVTKTTNALAENADLMGKVYFPRFAAPLSGLLSTALSTLISIGIFALCYVIYVLAGASVRLNLTALLLPLYFLHLGVLALGVGTLLAALTIKYKDLLLLLPYALMVWMYLSPVVYGLDVVPKAYAWLYLMNPASPVLAHIKHALFGTDMLCWPYYLLSLCVSILIFMLGSRLFRRVEKDFVDTI